MRSIIKHFDAAMKQRYPDIYKKMNPGASEATLAAAEGEFGYPLPETYRELYRWRNGCAAAGVFLSGELITIDDAMANHATLKLEAEDVVTTGGSSLLAIERAEAFGLKVRGVIAIIDRLEGGHEAFAQRGYELTSLLTIRDLGVEPPSE